MQHLTNHMCARVSCIWRYCRHVNDERNQTNANYFKTKDRASRKMCRDVVLVNFMLHNTLLCCVILMKRALFCWKEEKNSYSVSLLKPVLFGDI